MPCHRLAFCDKHSEFSGSFRHPDIEKVKTQARESYDRGERTFRKVWLAEKPLDPRLKVIVGSESIWSSHLGLKVGSNYFQLEKETKVPSISKNIFEISPWSRERDQENTLEHYGFTYMTDDEIYCIGEHYVYCWPLARYDFIWNNCQTVAFAVLEDIIYGGCTYNGYCTDQYYKEGVAYKVAELRALPVRHSTRMYLQLGEYPEDVIDQYEEQLIGYFLLCNDLWRSSGTPWRYARLKAKLETTSKPFSTLAKGSWEQVVSDMHLFHDFVDFLPYIQGLRDHHPGPVKVAKLRNDNQRLSNRTKVPFFLPAVVTGSMKYTLNMLILADRHSGLFSNALQRRAQSTFKERHRTIDSIQVYAQKKFFAATGFVDRFWDGVGPWEECLESSKREQQHWPSRFSESNYATKGYQDPQYFGYSHTPDDRYYNYSTRYIRTPQFDRR